MDILSKIHQRAVRIVKYALNQKMDSTLKNQVFKIVNFALISTKDLSSHKVLKMHFFFFQHLLETLQEGSCNVSYWGWAKETFRVNKSLRDIKSKLYILKNCFFQVVYVFLFDTLITMLNVFWWILKNSPPYFNFIQIKWNIFNSSISFNQVCSCPSIFKLKYSPTQG